MDVFCLSLGKAQAIGAFFLVSLNLASLLFAQEVHSSPTAMPARRSYHNEEELLAKMTLEEKVGQLVQVSGVPENVELGETVPLKEEYKPLIRAGRIGSILNLTGAENTNAIQRIAVEESRLGIPILFGLDVIHGYRTIFPIPLALAASWDPGLVEQVAAFSAEEARAHGIRWTFAPMVDVTHDPRWGRIAEGPGEDPFLASAMARAWVRGFQGESFRSPGRLAACPKHFVAYGAVEGGRDYNTVSVSLPALWELYLPPFEEAIAAGAPSVMAAFVSVNGRPMASNSWLLRHVLRQELGFRGVVLSDWKAVGELITHGIASNSRDAARQALLAGVDVDMESGVYAANLAELVREGVVSEGLLDEAVRRVLRLKFEVGLFDNPYTIVPRSNGEGEHSNALPREGRELARLAAQRSVVLLKNDNNLLPLSKDLHSVAVIGPLAADQENLLGPWHACGHPSDVVTVLEGIRAKLSSKTKLLYAKGCDINGESTSGFAEALRAAKEAEVAIVVVGEASWMSGEAGSRASLGLPGKQEELVRLLYEAGCRLVVIVLSGRPLAIPWIADHVPALFQAWFPGIEGGNAIADLLFGDAIPSGKLPVTVPRSTGQIPIYYNHENTGRPPGSGPFSSVYIDIPTTPLFPFGYGLSYTRFVYRDLQVERSSIPVGGTVRLSAWVQNVGQRTGEEVVQLYLRDMVSSLTRPVRELKGFRRVRLAPGQSARVEFTLGPKELGFHLEDGRFVVEPGKYQVWIGGSSEGGASGFFEVSAS